MRKTIILILITAVLASVLPCAVYADDYTTIYTASSYMEGYSKIISDYENAYAELKNGVKAYEFEDKYPGIYWMAFLDFTSVEPKYFLKDIDNNGISELFITGSYENSSHWSGSGFIFGMYTFKDGNILGYAYSTGRGRYYLLDTGELFGGTFGGMYSHGFYTYTFSNYNLVSNDTIVIGELDGDEWSHNGEILSSDQAEALLEEKTKHIVTDNFKPLSEFVNETAETDSGISVLLNGKEMSFDQEPAIIDGRTMVPLRAIFEAMGYTVDWDQTTQTAEAVKGADSITVQLNNSSVSYTLNGEAKTYTCDTVPQAINGRTLVPVRAIAECAGCEVNWDSSTKTVTITS